MKMKKGIEKMKNVNLIPMHLIKQIYKLDTQIFLTDFDYFNTHSNFYKFSSKYSQSYCCKNSNIWLKKPKINVFAQLIAQSLQSQDVQIQ